MSALHPRRAALRLGGALALAVALSLSPSVGATAAGSGGRVEERLAQAALHMRAREYEAALRIWKQLAAGEVREAQYRLGIAYRSGRGVETDHARAAKWLKEAARHGHPGAQYALGALYQKGWGVPADRERALELYEAAARQGHERARERLQQMLSS